MDSEVIRLVVGPVPVRASLGLMRGLALFESEWTRL